MSSTLKARGAKATPALADILYLSNFAGNSDGYISVLALLALAQFVVDDDNGEIDVGSDDFTLVLKGNFWQVFTNGNLIAQADETGWQFKTTVTGKQRDLQNSDDSEVTPADAFVNYVRTDEADLVMPAGNAMQASQQLVIFNGSADPVNLTEMVGSGFVKAGGAGNTMILGPHCAATFMSVNVTGIGGVLGVISDTGCNFPE